jgi:hypothetical protein
VGAALACGWLEPLAVSKKPAGTALVALCIRNPNPFQRRVQRSTPGRVVTVRRTCEVLGGGLLGGGAMAAAKVGGGGAMRLTGSGRAAGSSSALRFAFTIAAC